MKEKIPLVYLCIHNRLIDKIGVGIVSTKIVFEIFGKFYRFEKVFRHPILKELNDYGLVVKHSSSEVDIRKSIFDTTNSSKVYKLVGLY